MIGSKAVATLISLLPCDAPRRQVAIRHAAAAHESRFVVNAGAARFGGRRQRAVERIAVPRT